MPIRSTKAAHAHAYSTAFLVYNLFQDAANTLINNQVWSIEYITF